MFEFFTFSYKSYKLSANYTFKIKRAQDIDAKTWSVRWQWHNTFGEKRKRGTV